MQARDDLKFKIEAGIDKGNKSQDFEISKSSINNGFKNIE